MNPTQISQAQASSGLFLRASSAWPNNVSMLATVGQGQASTSLSNIATGYDRTLTLSNNASNGTFTLATNNAVGFDTTSGINLKDFEGNTLGTITELKGLYIRCNSGSANISGNTANIVDCQIDNGGRILMFNEANGLGSSLTNQTLTITATSNSTTLQITAVGT